jgi:hypothetical protein
VYGIQGFHPGGGSPATSAWIDFDGSTDGDKTRIGDVEIPCVEPCINNTGCIDPPGMMVGWWPLDEPAGASVIHDLAGVVANQGTPQPNGVLGPPGGPESVPGKVAGAVLFDSNASTVGPYVEIPDQAELDFGTGAFSIDAWVKGPPQGAIYILPIVDKLNSSTGYSLNLINTWGSAAQIRFTVGDGTSADFHSGGTTTIPLDNTTWSHLAVTVDRSTNTVKLYINGGLVSTQSCALFGSINNTLPVLIGEARLPGLVQEAIDVDELEMFDCVLTLDEVRAIWAAGSAGKCKCPRDISGIQEGTEIGSKVPALGFPNPFKEDTGVQFALDGEMDVQVRVFDVGGREVRALQSGRLAAGSHYVHWDGLDGNGVRVKSGIYFIRVRAGGRVLLDTKLVRLR